MHVGLGAASFFKVTFELGNSNSTNMLENVTVKQIQGSRRLSLGQLFLSGDNSSLSTIKEEQLADGTKKNRILQTVPDPNCCERKLSSSSQCALRGSVDSVQDLKEDPEVPAEALVPNYWKEFAGLPSEIQWASNIRKRHQEFVDSVEGANIAATGSKIFVVVANQEVEFRSNPTFDDSARTGTTLLPGQCVLSERTVRIDHTRYIRVADKGWVFQSKNGKQILAPIDCAELGSWWYEVTCSNLIETRIAPVTGDWARSGIILCPSQVNVVCLRCAVNGESWLMLANGIGWVFEKTPSRAEEPSFQQTLLAECYAKSLPGRGVGSRNDMQQAAFFEQSLGCQSVNSKLERWDYEVVGNPVLALGNWQNGALLHPGEKVGVTVRATASGRSLSTAMTDSKNSDEFVDRVWLKLSDGRGWVPKTNMQGTMHARFTGVRTSLQAEGSLLRKPGSNIVNEENEWQVGIV